MDEPTLDALQRLRESGRKLLMVTGREQGDLVNVCPQLDLFDRVVSENGATVYDPATKEAKDLCEPPDPRFVAALRGRGIPVSVGRVIVATREPHQDVVLEVIKEFGLELQVIFNKGAVMVLPSGVNKATGMAAALAELGLSPHNVVGVGDAENDHAFLAASECAAAVANALPALKERSDVLLKHPRGAGVAELIQHLIDDDLASATLGLVRHHVRIGERGGGGGEAFNPYGTSLMVCGTSGSGKSTLTTGLLERLHAAGYQFVVIDPEGDYTGLELAVVLGSPQRAPLADEVLDLVREPGRNAVVNLLGIALEHRPAFFAELLPRLLELRARTGRPHWLVVDEAHHLLPTAWQPAKHLFPGDLKGTLFITVHPESVSPVVVQTVDTLFAVGERPADTVAEFCQAADESAPRTPNIDKLESGDAVLWRRGEARAVLVHTEPPKTERKRHSRKYAEGNLGPDRSFYFRGPDDKLNLKAQNLVLFLQIADGVDDATWEHHRQQGDYSRWLREQVKDAELGDEVAKVEQARTPTGEARAAVRAAVERRYTLPADKPSGITE
jgi:hydroxymethylpyrimidine pyrophosphatase-like HAD family hydrolase